MREVKGSVASEAFQGAVYGLGMSFLVWIPLSAGGLADTRASLLCLAGALAGISRRWAGWPVPAALPWMASAWLLEGPFASMLIGVTATLGAHLAWRRPGFWRRLAFDAGSTVLAVAGADVLARGLQGALQSTVLFSAAFGAAQFALHRLRLRLAGTVSPRWLPDAAGSLAIVALSAVGAWVVSMVWMRPGWHAWLAVFAALRLGLLVGTATARRRPRPWRNRTAPAPLRVRDRMAAALAATLPEGAPGDHLWRTEALCRAMADRLGSDPSETRLLSQAALLHHAGRLAYEDPEIDVHPSVIEQTVEQLGFDTDVQTTLIHAREFWDGNGRRRLRGERISRGGRILAVADRYDQLAHGASGSRGHSMAMALLRNESNGRFDPLMFEILDELGERLEASDSNLAQSPSSAGTAGRTRLALGERDLQTLYSIERATTLPIGLSERLTLIAGLLRSIVPFTRMQVDLPNGETFQYGDRESGTHDRTVALNDGPREVGVLQLTDNGLSEAEVERLGRAAAKIAGMFARDDHAHADEGLTDPSTGLPNARFLRRTLERRIPAAGHVAPGFGLIVVHVRRLGPLEQRHGRAWAERYLNAVARRLAGACDERESLVRLGPDQFIVLTGESRGGELVRRWRTLVDDVAGQALMLDGQVEDVRLDAAHAAHPLDGDGLEALLATLEARLTGHAACVVPFPKTRVG